MRKRPTAFLLAIVAGLGSAGCHRAAGVAAPTKQASIHQSGYEDCLGRNIAAVRSEFATVGDLPKPGDITVNGTRLTIRTAGDAAAATVDMPDDDQVISYNGKAYSSVNDTNAWYSGAFIDLPKPEQSARGFVNLLSQKCPTAKL